MQVIDAVVKRKRRQGGQHGKYLDTLMSLWLCGDAQILSKMVTPVN